MASVKIKVSGMPDFAEFMDYTNGDPNGEFVLNEVQPGWYLFIGPCTYNMRCDGAGRWWFGFNDGSIHETATRQGSTSEIPTGSYGPIDGSLGAIEVLHD